MSSKASIYLRPIQEEDLPSIHQTSQDETMRYLTGTHRSFTLEQVRQSYRQFAEDASRYDFAICLRETDQLLGDMAILDIDGENHKAGFRIALHHHGALNQGYGTEATRQAQVIAFERLGLNRLELEVFSHNPRGIRAYEKAGFVQEGVLRQALCMNGTYSDEILMGMLRKDYERFSSI